MHTCHTNIEPADRCSLTTIRQEIDRHRHAPEAPRTVLVVLLVLGVWLFAHPWQGIWHDARLYALQALSHLRPEAYRNDLFFFSGSQEKYTFFSPLYAALISLIGLKAAALTLLLGGYVLWIGSAGWLLRGFLRGFPFWLGMVLIFSMPRGYSGYGDVFNYAESFLTPRLIAEGFTLLSLALIIRGQQLASLLTMAIAFAIHPLMALAGAGFVVLYMAQDRPKSALGFGALGIGLLWALALFNIAPFDRLLTTMDSEWYELAFSRSPYVFWDGWKPEQWLNRDLLAFSLLVTAGLVAVGKHRRAFLACLLMGCASLLLTWAGTSLFHVLLIQIQPWRSLWLVQLFSYIAAAWLVSQYWSRSQFHRFLLAGFLTASMAFDNAGGVISLTPAILFIWQALSRRNPPLQDQRQAALPDSDSGCNHMGH